MSNSTIEQQAAQHDEIDLFQLIETLWHGKLLIILISLFFLAAGTGYIYLSTPVYESRAFLLPPTEKGIVELSRTQLLSSDSIASTSLAVYTTQDVYKTFNQFLNSNNAKKRFFEQDEVNAYFMERSANQLQAWNVFNKAISINSPKTNEATKTDVSFKTDSPELSSSWTNSYIDLVLNLTRQQITQDLQEKINVHLSQLDLRITNRHKIYKSEIDAELAKLREALLIAEAVQLHEPLLTDSTTELQNPMMIDEIRRLYRSGSNALKAEITTIEKRRENPALTPGLAELLQQKGLITSLVIDANKIKPAQIDLPAQIDNKPIAPKKALTLALSIIIGFMIGIITVLVKTSINNRREKIS